jgi:hypothetical protein
MPRRDSRDTQRPVTLSRLLGVAVITGEKTGNHQENSRPQDPVKRYAGSHGCIRLSNFYMPIARPHASHLFFRIF